MFRELLDRRHDVWMITWGDTVNGTELIDLAGAAAALARRRLTGEDAVAFDALDSWLFHQRDLEGGVFFDLVDLARANPFVEPAVIDGTRIDPGKVQLPVLVALASRDHLVPAGSSLAARHAFPNTTLLDVPSGHVGMLARARSERLLYGPASDWIVDVASR